LKKEILETRPGKRECNRKNLVIDQQAYSKPWKTRATGGETSLLHLFLPSGKFISRTLLGGSHRGGWRKERGVAKPCQDGELKVLFPGATGEKKNQTSLISITEKKNATIRKFSFEGSNLQSGE